MYRIAVRKKRADRTDIAVKCLAVYFVMMPFDSFPVFGMGSLLRLAAFLPLAAVLVLRRKTKLRINSLTAAYMLYAAVNILTVFYSVDVAASLFELKRLLMNSVLILVAGGMYTSYTEKEADLLLRALIAGGLATVVMTLAYADTSAAGRLTLSVNGTPQDQNYINGYMYFAFSYFVNKAVGDKKPAYALPALLLMVFTLLTGSRGAAAALAAVCAAAFLYQMAHADKLWTGALAAAGAAALAVGFEGILSLLPPEVAVRFSLDYIANYRGTNRTALWGRVLEIYGGADVFRQLLGHGYGTVPAVNTFDRLTAHNLWLEHLISGGAVGLAVLVFMQAAFMREAWRRKNAVVFASYAGYLAMCMTLSLTNYKPMWNCMIMIMVMRNVRERRPERDGGGDTEDPDGAGGAYPEEAV